MEDPRFPLTRWSIVLIAAHGDDAESRAALATLCETYWYPLYAFVRRQGYTPDQAQDLTQGFFARLLEKNYLQDFRREKGRFRTFLLACLRHFLSNERDWAQAGKRGGGVLPESLDSVIESGEHRYGLEPRDTLTPEQLFERHWALALLVRSMGRLRGEQAESRTFPALEQFLTGDDATAPYRQIAGELATTETAVKAAVHRLRRRFREIVRDEIAQTVARPEEVGEEVRHLISILSGQGSGV